MRNEPSEFGIRLRQLREAAGLTQEELAERAGVTAQAVSALERGHRRQPYTHTVRALAAALGGAETNLQLLLAAARTPAQDSPAQVDPRRPSVSALPSGTVTLLLTDVEGSTRLWEVDSEGMRAALVRHDALMQEIVAQHGGSVVRPRGEGDGRFAVFASASDGVTAAAAIQQALAVEAWPTPEPVRVRIALHTGEADQRDGDYFGPVVNRCARLCSTAHGGQILISEVLAGLVADGLPDQLSLRDMGQHRLKDLLRPERIFQVDVRGLQDAFPPLVGLASGPHNLPVQTTTLVGRGRLLSELRLHLLQPDLRLLTLTGPGGTGKTRLALQLAADALDGFEHGVWFIDLAPITDPELVLPAIAQVLEVKEEAGRRFADTLKDRIGDKSQLLLLDNFEQIVPASLLVAELLRACPRLKVLVTSRAVLGLQGEQVFAVPPLQLPKGLPFHGAEPFAEVEAMRLFAERARAARPGFVLTNENAPTVAAICQRLDGLPLAIELAAARVRVLPPDALLGRLAHRLTLLTTGPRDSASRHHTLRTAIAWSDDLLEPSEQVLFRRLAVHVGGWTLEAGEALCNLDAHLGLDALDGTTALVDKSLITQVLASEGRTNPRFRMLETIREYALERLDSSGESERIRDWHAAHYLAVAELAATRLDGNEQVAWLDRLDDEHDNIRAALAWSMQRQQWATSLRLAAALPRFWLVRGHLTEGREHLAKALAGSEGVPAQIRARALNASGLLAQYQDDYRLAAAYCTESLALYRSMDDRPGVVATLQTLGRIARLRGELAECQSLYEESVTISNQIGDRRAAAQALNGLGVSFWWVGEVARARPLLMDALAMFRELDDLRGISDTLSHLAFASYLDGDLSSARLLHEEALTMFGQLRDKRGIARSAMGLGHVAMSQGQHTEAAVLLQEALHAFTSLGERWLSYGSLIGLARVTLQLDHADTAARLLGVADALAQTFGTPQRNRPSQADWLFVDEVTAAGRQHLGDECFDAAQSKGRNLTPEQALGLLRVEIPGADTDARLSPSAGA